jgi:hypothetical protein
MGFAAEFLVQSFRLPHQRGAAQSRGAMGARGAGYCSAITRNGAAGRHGSLATLGAAILPRAFP